jgi:putative addiction module component (TIGR02574 family)
MIRQSITTAVEVAMAPTIQELGLDQISPEDRLAVAEALWGSVAREVEEAPPSAAQRAELERRLADSIARPDSVTPWEEIKARALARARQ